jgi:TM2 domain-containing membrane protein YozV
MGLILVIVLLFVLFGGGFGYHRGYYGGGGLGLTGLIEIVFIVILLAGCTDTQLATARSIERTACVIDQSGQVAIVPIEGIASALEPVAALPIAIAHKATQLGCAVVLARKPGG